MQDFNQLNEFVQVDAEKRELIRRLEMELNSKAKVLQSFECSGVSLEEDAVEPSSKVYEEHELCDMDYELSEPMMKESRREESAKACPKCGRRFPKSENFCPDCLVSLKPLTGGVQIRDIKTSPVFTTFGTKESDNILTDECIALIDNFNFSMNDFNDITRSIKAQAYRNLDDLIRANEIDLDGLDILDKVLLFAKSFASVEYKSYGADLGYFEFDRISVDDRQRKSLQITTLIHELSHFLIKEILVHITCRILDVAKNSHVESVITYILSNSILNRMIDEYAAHSVEGRFAMFGYQDYSSFSALQNEIDAEHVEITKTIGNTFAIHIKEILEGFLDWDLREEIKQQFLSDTIEGPDYRQLGFESCKKLSDEGFLRAIWLILTEGFKSVDRDVLDSYMKEL